MARLRALVLVAPLASLLGGCPTSTTGADVPIEMLGGSYAAVSCGLIRDCYGEALVGLLSASVDQAACESRAEAAYVNAALPRFQAAIAMGTLSYDGSQARPCVDAIRALGCSAVSNRQPTACDALFVGHVAAGGACAMNEECAGDSYCSVSAACPGTCQARGGSGNACANDEACQSGLRCAGGTCSAPAGEGASCQGTTNVDCAGGLICAGASGTTAGTCRSVSTVFGAASGAVCNVQMTQLCATGSSCALLSRTEQTCQASGLADGAACHLSFPDQCTRGSYCSGTDLAMLDLEGTCAPLPTSGACAQSVGGVRCADGYACDGTSCVEIHDNGGTCTSGAGCYSGLCTAGTCTTPTYCPS